MVRGKMFEINYFELEEQKFCIFDMSYFEIMV